MKHLLSLIITFCLFISSSVRAEFNFCQENQSGQGNSGHFQQQIPYFNIVEVGELPAGVSEVEVNLTSDQDIDIQLYDKLTGQRIIHWPYGLLSKSGYQSLVYHGSLIEWSGFQGDGQQYGNEYIKISGATDPSTPTTRAYIMRVFGYGAGLADVSYRWGQADCDNNGNASGSGSFEQQITKDAIVDVGAIPPGINNLEISLQSAEDVDIQLYDTDSGTAIVAWPSGILKGHGVESTLYKNMEIEWSGYNGDGTNPGHEYIKIRGKTSANLLMKVFGYESGLATVTYQWGDNAGNNSAEEKIKAEILGLINDTRSQGRYCGNTYFPAANPLTWNSKLYQAALTHVTDMVTNNFFSHTGSDGSNAGSRISATGYNWYTYRENIAAGYFSAQSVVDGWLASSGHCSSIMNASVTQMGVAKASGGLYGMNWTQVFARPF